MQDNTTMTTSKLYSEQPLFSHPPRHINPHTYIHKTRLCIVKFIPHQHGIQHVM